MTTNRQAPAWVEARVAVPTGWHELAAEALAIGPCTTVAVGAHSVASKPPPAQHEYVRTFFPAADDGPDLRAKLQAALDRLAGLTEEPELEGLGIDFLPLPPEDYATSWRKSWRPFRLRRKDRELLVLPAWDRGAEQAPSADLHLWIQPGGSFGSGRHATTRTCMAVLLERIRGGERVLDAGTGSGILAVLARLAGAEEALGFDTDPVSKPAAEELAKENNTSHVQFRTGTLECVASDEGPFDVVLANIYSDVIQAEAARLASVLAPGGWFAFSGCPLHHLEATRAAILAAGLRIDQERLRGRWMTFVGGGKPVPPATISHK